MKKFNLRKVFFYCLGGGSGALLNFASLYVLVSIFGMNYIYGITIASFLNLTYNFIFHRSLTFGVKDKAAKRIALYYGFGVLLFLVTLGLAIFFKAVLGMNYMVAQIVATAISVILNFFISKLIVFKETI